MNCKKKDIGFTIIRQRKRENRSFYKEINTREMNGLKNKRGRNLKTLIKVLIVV